MAWADDVPTGCDMELAVTTLYRGKQYCSSRRAVVSPIARTAAVGGPPVTVDRRAYVYGTAGGGSRILCAVNEVGNRPRFATVIINGPKVREPKPTDYDGSGPYLSQCERISLAGCLFFSSVAAWESPDRETTTHVVHAISLLSLLLS